MAPIHIPELPDPIRYNEGILLIGSCFTEHIGQALTDAKFRTMQNPQGILFDPASVVHSLIRYIDNKPYDRGDLFELNEVWNSWHHHSRLSGADPDRVLAEMNRAVQDAHTFLSGASWVIITLGSSYSYRGVRERMPAEHYTDRYNHQMPVANCHRAPSGWFDKHLLGIDETISLLDTCYHRLRQFNPDLKILFTISPVRHLRDGVVENNRSKARLIESVHHMTGKFDGLYYFPAYELLIDVLRDYRFYDVDLAHPNYQGTAYVLEQFQRYCLAPEARELMEELKKLLVARKHRAFQPQTLAHQRFLQMQLQKTRELLDRHPHLDLSEELAYFSQHPAGPFMTNT